MAEDDDEEPEPNEEPNEVPDEDGRTGEEQAALNEENDPPA